MRIIIISRSRSDAPEKENEREHRDVSNTSRPNHSASLHTSPNPLELVRRGDRPLYGLPKHSPINEIFEVQVIVIYGGRL
jgi:hypothetical protein